MSNIITITNDNETYKIITKFAEDDSFEVTVLNERNSYFSKVLKADIEKFSTKFEINFDDYFDSLRMYFSIVHPHIAINIVNNELVVYKNMKVKYFYTPVQKTDYDLTIENIIETLALEGLELENSCANLEKAINQNQTDAEYYDAKLQDLVNDFETYKVDYNSSFCKVLNSKKRRIQFLMDTLEGKDTDNKEANPERIDNMLSDSDDEHENKVVNSGINQLGNGESNNSIHIDNGTDSNKMDVEDDELTDEEHSVISECKKYEM